MILVLSILCFVLICFTMLFYKMWESECKRSNELAEELIKLEEPLDPICPIPDAYWEVEAEDNLGESQWMN